MHRLVTVSGGLIACKPLPEINDALLQGRCAFTTFRLPIPDIWLAAHLERLDADGRFFETGLPVPADKLVSWIQTLPPEQIIRLTLVPDTAGAQLILTQRDLPSPPSAPLRLKTVAYEPVLPCIKHGSLAERFYLREQARTAGYDDVLWVNHRGHITESTTANVFFIRSDTLITAHPERDGCLPGITRLRLLQYAQQNGIPVQETSFPPSTLKALDGAFLTNAVRGLMPVTAIDGHPLPWPEAPRKLYARLASALPEFPAPLFPDVLPV